jgi:uncharacterized membrane protein SpoIIM required for sporulation
LRLAALFILVTMLFVIGLVWGLAAPSPRLIQAFQGKPGFRPVWSSPATFLYIFLHNLGVSLLLYLASLVYVGLLIVVVNGYILGSASVLAVHSGYSWIQVASAIVPHGVIEIPALLLAAASGLETVGLMRSGGGVGAVARSMKRLFIVAVLLAAAAFMETYVTPRVAASTGFPVNG